MNGFSQPIDLTAIAVQALREKNFLTEFSPEATIQAALLQPTPVPNLKTLAKDLRHLLWFSIDNNDSRDLDQLTYAEKVNPQKYKIFVAIANVSETVMPGTPIDLHAMQNTTSIYTPTKIFPMLPERLSTDLTSLNPKEDRLAVVFEAGLSTHGCVEDQAIYLAYVHNYAKLAYSGVTAWLEGGPAPKPFTQVQGLAEQLRLQDEIARILSDYRHQFGALCVETIETSTEITNGIPVAIVESKKNRAKSIIENFMIVANTVSAYFAEQNKLLSLRRVVRTPKRWDKIVSIAKELGTSLPENPDPIALEQLLATQKRINPTGFSDLSLSIIKLLGRGEYVVSSPGKLSPGHFGLALRDYTHSTAPNRRFPDLITQRYLLAALQRITAPYQEADLSSLAAHCTEREDLAEKVERKTRKSAAAFYLSPHIGQEFDAIVTGTASKGTWVRIIKPPVEGKLIRGMEKVDVGDRLKVKLIYTNVLEGFIDFVPA